MKDFKRYLLFLLLFSLLLACFCLNSCAPDQKGQKQEEEACVSFTDALERTVTVSKNPKRVAALLGSFADIWLLAGGDLCAAASDAWEDFGYSGSAVNLGGAHSPSLELLLSSDPDLVLASAQTASNVEMKEMLESAGITVVYFDVLNFDDYLHMLDFCTDLTERKDLYQVNGLGLLAQIEAVKKAYAEEDISKEKRKILLLRVSSSKVKAKASEGTVLGEMLSDMGCINIADNDRNLLENLSIEAVIEKKPYHIFAVAMGDDTKAAEDSLNRLLCENPAWASLEAVRCGRVHMMDKTLFNLKPNDRFAEAYEELYEVLTENKN